VVAASELAANSILHGGGRGLASVWGEGGAVFVEVADAGTITDPTVGRVRPAPTADHGRGLYIANRLCDEVSIDTGSTGTRIRLRMAVGRA
jgi:anti-sigma regulatory factor (Ser/Thr protein kinase)